LIFREVEDRDLIEKSRRGDVDAFNVLVSRWEKRVFTYLVRNTGDREDALDLAQDTFLKAYRGLASLTDVERFPQWLFRIAHNEAMSMHRRGRLQVADGEDLEQTDADSNGPARSLGNRMETTLMVEQALAGLPAEQRDAVTLKVYQGFKFDEIAEIVDCPVSTAKSRVYAGLEALKLKLAPATEKDGREAHARRSS
jgi:RNA polymerase sigma-70 factor (ECF subfamily)